MKIINIIRNYCSKVLKVFIKKFYKNLYLKLLYGIITPNIENDKFARTSGIIELLNSKKILNTKNPICNEFIISRFAKNARDYEKIVEKSGYTSRELSKCVRIIKKCFFNIKKQTNIKRIKILDLGCGTGLLGSKLSNLNILLTGVDISKDMLKYCERKNLYEKIYCDDLISFLEKSNEKYNIITACSVVPFFSPKKLERLIKLVSENLSLEGYFIFSFDICDQDFKVNSKLFCEHSDKLIINITKKFFKFTKIDPIQNSRLENGKIVKGAICTCKNHI